MGTFKETEDILLGKEILLEQNCSLQTLLVEELSCKRGVKLNIPCAPGVEIGPGQEAITKCVHLCVGHLV